jgi:hypothetical protein
VDVTTHLRGRACQAGAFLAVIGGLLVVAPAPAQAAAPSVRITNISNANLQSGQRTSVTYEVTNNNPESDNAVISIAVSSSQSELTCSGDRCNFTTDEIKPGPPQKFTVEMVAGQMQSGASKNAEVVVRATVDGVSKTASQGVTIRGDNKSPTVREIKGKVRDNQGKPVSGAEVGIQDSAGHRYVTTTNGGGNYKFTSSDERPIAPGQITLGARKDGFEIATKNVNVAAGQAASVDLALQLIGPSASATPSASPTASSEVTAEPTEGQPTADTKLDAQPAAGDGKDDEGSSSLIFIIVGGLLVAAGIGAIVLVLMRRKENDAANDLDGEQDGTALGARSTPTPPSQGRYGGAADATRIAGRGADATMIAGAAGRPSLSDAPTMLQQAVPDEFPDPYGAPAAVPHAGYAAAGTAGWGAAAVPAAAPAATPYGAPTQGAYGAAAPATPTSVYGAPAAPGGGAYGVPAQSGPPAGNSYGAPNQYGRPPAQGGAYGAGAAEPYGRPSSGAGYDSRPQSGAPHGAPQSGASYGAADQQRYDEPTGRYDPAAAPASGHQVPGYQPSGYQAPGHQAPGYEAPGYEQGGYQGGGGYRGGDQGRSQDLGGHPAGPGGFRPPPAAGGGYPAEPDYPQTGRQQAVPDVPYQAGGGYSSQSGGGYASAAGHPAPEPEQANPYGTWSPGAGIDSGNAYGAPAGGDYGRGGYGTPAPAAGGYDEPTGYDPRGTYGRPDSYDRAPEQPGRAPQQPPAGYDEPGYYGGEQQQPPPGGRHGGGPQEPRRPLDWLDD